MGKEIQLGKRPRFPLPPRAFSLSLQVQLRADKEVVLKALSNWDQGEHNDGK